MTALAFPDSPGPDASSPACDAAVMKAARKEGELRAALFECETFVHFINAVSSYPAVLGPEGDAVEWLIQTCFRVSAEEYSRSGVCPFVVGRGTPTR